MPLALIITIDYTQPPDVAKRKWSDFTKAANEEVAETWQEKHAPLHFESFAEVKYGYRARRPKTLKKKQGRARRGITLHGGQRALVDTGLLQRQMTRRGILRVFPTRFTLDHPTHVPRRPRNSSIDLHAELVKVTPSEDRFLARVWERRIELELLNYKPRRRVKP